MNQLVPIANEVFGFTVSSKDKEKLKLKQVIELVRKGEIEKAVEIADTLSHEYRDKIPSDIMFKFSQLAEMSGAGGGANASVGSGEGMATKNAFKKVVRKKLNEISYGKFNKQTKTRTKSE